MRRLPAAGRFMEAPLCASDHQETCHDRKIFRCEPCRRSRPVSRRCLPPRRSHNRLRPLLMSPRAHRSARRASKAHGAPSFVFTLEASADTPSLTLPEREAQALADARANQIAKIFDEQLDPEIPVNIRNTDGLPIVRGERRTRAVVLPADGKLPYTPEALKESRPEVHRNSTTMKSARTGSAASPMSACRP